MFLHLINGEKIYNTQKGIHKKVKTHSILLLSLTQLAPIYAKTHRRKSGSYKYLKEPKIISV